MAITNPLNTLNDGGISNIYDYQDVTLGTPTLDKGPSPAERTMDEWLEKLTNPTDSNTFILNTLNPSVSGENLEPNAFAAQLRKSVADIDKEILKNKDVTTKNDLIDLKKDIQMQLNNQDFITELRKILIQG